MESYSDQMNRQPAQLTRIEKSFIAWAKADESTLHAVRSVAQSLSEMSIREQPHNREPMAFVANVLDNL